MSIKKFQDIIRFLIGPAAGIDIATQFRPGEADELSVARNLNASCLIVLAGPAARGHADAREYLDRIKGERTAAGFFSDSAGLVLAEVGERSASDREFREQCDDLHGYIASGRARGECADLTGRIRSLFFPEGVIGGLAAEVEALREKRIVEISEMSPEPIRSPEREVLFTANLLLTLPPAGAPEAPGMDPDVKKAVDAARGEEQRYWYDHPIPVGSPGNNELIHGLTRLSEAVRFEEKTGGMEAGGVIDCVLSASVTHPSLRAAARPWARSELDRAGGLCGINVYLFTDDDTEHMIDEVLAPAGKNYCGSFDEGALRQVFGVDGEYGRHYSFLKAIAAFWHVLISASVRATFKMDLDQAFPQAELVRETGASAFGHFRTPLWGARGVDARGNPVYLGMIAGSLVNRADAGASLFTPDVRFPEGDAPRDEVVFRSAVPQALSTLAEMMTRYIPGGRPDGAASALQRVHVTGGTTGILVEALREYRPFTPTCVGRAEDQAYLLSVLGRAGARGFLRYAHGAGLVMRHDADLFAGQAARAATGKVLGDYARTILFSGYARALPWPMERIKCELDPFTGCFISRIPITIVLLRFTLRAASLFDTAPDEGLRFFNEGIRRLSALFGAHAPGKNPLVEIYERERAGWDSYYDVLDALERKIASGDPFAQDLKGKAMKIVDSARI
ncbi:MAG: hypothetical protein JW807_02770 [Spirochaetes bacterium]|nr:hypothetical protein [Spirochaetota bacterium]